MFRAVVFDMDGVITDTEKLYRRFQLEEGKKLGIPDDVMVVACERIAGGTKYTNKKSFEDVVGMGIDYFDFREAVVNKLDAHIRAYMASGCSAALMKTRRGTEAGRRRYIKISERKRC